MEQVHGVDVSWMTQASPKDKVNKKPPSPPAPTTTPARPGEGPLKPTSAEPKPAPQSHPQTNGHGNTPPTTNGPNSPIPRRRSRAGSVDKYGPNGTPPGRRNSWFSNMTAKFSSNHNAPGSEQHGANTQQDTLPEHEEHDSLPPPPPVSHPRVSPVGARSAVLPPANKPTGNAPYTPAPPKSSQPGFLGVFRRLSSSGPAGHAGGRLGNGLVERKILNVDHNRQRCPMPELRDAKLRKVSFCVDVEIAPMPKYADTDVPDRLPVDNTQKKKLTEKGEGDALKNPKSMEEHKEAEGTPEVEVTEVPKAPSPPEKVSDESLVADENSKKDEAAPETNKKKEKKKKSEEERKARKEKKRKLAEANGSIPMEIHYSSDSSFEVIDAPASGTASGLNTPPKSQQFPTTNPVRIYRRCCQLRETPILKKITEQLLEESNSSTATGMVNKLDLTGYMLQLGDFVTLGDYLAIVPVREVILENSGLNDESLRVVLAGLLAARCPDLRRRKPKHELETQGGVVERLVIKDNQIGPDGWKHLSLFIYLCQSLRLLDVSRNQFPRQAACQASGQLPNGAPVPKGAAEILSRALSERMGGSTLELINMSETEPTMDQLGKIIDGVINCGVKRFSLANNNLDDKGVEHVSRYLSSGICRGLDLGGNDIGNHMEQIIAGVKETDPLWALSLQNCSLTPASLCKIIPTLSKLSDFRFIDLSHNHALFESTPSAVTLLRKSLPKMKPLKRMHLRNVGLTGPQAIALLEVVSEVPSLAHINILDNEALVKLSKASTEVEQEEACALFAAMLAAARMSNSLICVDMEVPDDSAGEVVKAMAKQVVAYCLRNMERMPDADITQAVAAALNESQIRGDTGRGDSKAGYPDVLTHILGHDVLDQDDDDDGQDPAPNEDYVIGGTGLVRALTCCLENRGDESRRPSGEFIEKVEGEEVSGASRVASAGQAKDMSKHLLAGARKIRHRLQPALAKAERTASDEPTLRKLQFLDQTLAGIIQRFEDEYPDTRQQPRHIESPPPVLNLPTEELSTSPPEEMAIPSDAEDDSKIHPPRPLSRSSSLSKLLAEEEGHTLRIGHRFRSGFFTKEHIDLLTSNIDDIGSDPKHVQMLTGMAEDIGGELLETMKEKGPVRTFKEDREMVMRSMKEADPEHWDKFVESQKLARANISLEAPRADDSAVAD